MTTTCGVDQIGKANVSLFRASLLTVRFMDRIPFVHTMVTRYHADNRSSRRLTIHTVVKTPAEANGTVFNYVVCAHKAIGQSSVPAQLAPVVDAKETTLVVIQNGVGNEEPFRQAFPDGTIITCVVSFP